MYSVETLAFNALSVIDKVSLCGSEPFRDLKTLRSSLRKTLSCEGNRIERRLRRSQQAWLLLSVACFGRFQSRFGEGGRMVTLTRQCRFNGALMAHSLSGFTGIITCKMSSH